MSKTKSCICLSLATSIILLSGCGAYENSSAKISSAKQITNAQSSTTTTTTTNTSSVSDVPNEETSQTTTSTDSQAVLQTTTTSAASSTTTTSAKAENNTNTVNTTTVATTSKPAVVTTTTKKATTTTKVTTTAKKTTTTKVTSTKDFPYDNKTYEYISEVVRLCNIERKEHGLSPLTLDTTITKAAMIRANELITNFDHTRPNGESCYTALKEAGASFWSAGENIAAGYTSPKDVVEGWLNSEGHRANILSENFNKIGIGYVYSTGNSYGHYWVQMFTD